MNRGILNDHAFMNYMRGVVAGDGTLSDMELGRRGVIRIRQTDEEWVRFMHAVIGPTSTVSRSEFEGKEWKDLWGFRVSDEEFVESMLGAGMIRAKSEHWDSFMIPEVGFELFFLRGLLDSDGHVSLEGATIQWLGTPAQMLWVNTVVRGTMRDRNRICVSYLGGDDARGMARSLLGLEDVGFLERKTEALKKMLVEKEREIVEKAPGRIDKNQARDWEGIFREEYRGKGRSSRSIAEELGVTSGTVCYNFRKRGLVTRGSWERGK